MELDDVYLRLGKFFGYICAAVAVLSILYVLFIPVDFNDSYGYDFVKEYPKITGIQYIHLNGNSENGYYSLLFWGAYVLLLGFLGTQAADAERDLYRWPMVIAFWAGFGFNKAMEILIIPTAILLIITCAILDHGEEEQEELDGSV